MIRVHVFYCVLGPDHASLLRRAPPDGIELSIPRLSELLNDIREVVLIWPRESYQRGVQQKRDTFQLSRMSAEQTRIVDAMA